MARSKLWGQRRASRRTLFRGVGVLSAGAAAAFLAACGGSDDDKEGGSSAPNGGSGSSTSAGSSAATSTKVGRGPLVKVGIDTDVIASSGMDPHTSNTNSGNWSLVYDQLIYTNGKGIQVPESSLAEKWEVTTPTRVVFHLRKGVTFQDGTAFNAESVRYNIDRARNPGLKGAVHIAAFSGIEKVEVMDEYTAAINLKAPDSTILALFSERAGFIISPAHVEKTSLEDLRSQPVGTGPYRLKEWKPGGFTSFSNYKEHWRKLADGGPAGRAEEIRIVNIPDPVVNVASYQSGEVDVIRPEASTLEILEKEGKSNIMEFPGAGRIAWVINHTLPPMDNVDFRRALAFAWNADAINKAIYAGRYTVSNSLFEHSSRYHKDVANYPKFDMNKAKEFMTKSGVPESARVVEISTSPNEELQILQAIARSWEQLGVRTVIAPENASSRASKNRGQAGDIHTFGSGGFRAEPNSMLQLYLTQKSSSNYGAQPIPDLEPLIAKGVAAYDFNERKKIYDEIQDIHASMLYSIIPVVYYTRWVTHRKGFDGTEFDMNGVATWRGLGPSA